MASVPLTFFFLAVVILLGFITSRLFQATRIPDIPILLSIGLVLGPLNRFALDHGFGSVSLSENIHLPTLQEFTPFVTSLALVVILFDSGLKLDFLEFGRSMRPAFLHTLPTFLLTVLAISLVARWIFGMPTLLAVVLGVALSNVGQTVSAALIRDISLDGETRSIYFIEMAIYDLVSIPLLVSILQFAQEGTGAADAGLFAQSLIRVLSVSILLGLAGGVLWIYVIRQMQNFPYHYMVTLAGLLLIYSINSFLGGSGPVSVLIFGLVIGNRNALLRLARKKARVILEGEKVHSFHEEITFFTRAFFFIFLGLTFSTRLHGEWDVESLLEPLNAILDDASLFLFGILLIFLAIVASRWIVVRYVSSRDRPERRSLFTVYGRGLGTAVLATFPFTLTAYQPAPPGEAAPNAYTALFQPWQPVFLNTALLVILLTVVGTSFAVWRLERQRLVAGAAAGAPQARPKE